MPKSSHVVLVFAVLGLFVLASCKRNSLQVTESETTAQETAQPSVAASTATTASLDTPQPTEPGSTTTESPQPTEPGSTATVASTESPAATSTAAPTVTPPADNTAAELINCASNIASDVPAFYSTYFRCTDISLDGNVVVIRGTGVPPHLSYYYGQGSDQYEKFDYSRGNQYNPNPNEIAENAYTIRIPLNPVQSGVVINGNTVNLTTGDSSDYPLGRAGAALDGVALFNPLARPGDDIEDEKYSFDSNDGHPQQQGAYHYHAVSHGPLSVLKALGFTTSDVPGVAEIELYGVMCDGTVVLGSRELDRSTPKSGLDLQAGHVHDIANAGAAVLLEHRYHIHMAPAIGASPRGLTPEAQYYSTCNITNR